MSNSVQIQSFELTKAKKSLKQAEKRISELYKLFIRLYEDNVMRRISNERFDMMLALYEDEQKALKSSAEELKVFICDAEKK